MNVSNSTAQTLSFEGLNQSNIVCEYEINRLTYEKVKTNVSVERIKIKI